MKKRSAGFYFIFSGVILLGGYIGFIIYQDNQVIADLKESSGSGLSALCPIKKTFYIIGTSSADSCESAKAKAIRACNSKSSYIQCPRACPLVQSVTSGGVVDQWSSSEFCHVTVECNYICDYGPSTGIDIAEVMGASEG